MMEALANKGTRLPEMLRRQPRVDHHNPTNVLAARDEMLRQREGDDPSERPASEHVGAVPAHAMDRRQAETGPILDGAREIHRPLPTRWGDSVDRLVRSETACKLLQVRTLASPGMHEQQRQAPSTGVEADGGRAVGGIEVHAPAGIKLQQLRRKVGFRTQRALPSQTLYNRIRRDTTTTP